MAFLWPVGSSYYQISLSIPETTHHIQAQVLTPLELIRRAVHFHVGIMQFKKIIYMNLLQNACAI